MWLSKKKKRRVEYLLGRGEEYIAYHMYLGFGKAEWNWGETFFRSFSHIKQIELNQQFIHPPFPP